MDIEGYEVEVLKGLSEAIAANQFDGDILFETHRPKYNENHSLLQQLQMLFDHGYRVKAVTSNQERISPVKDFYRQIGRASCRERV